MKIYVANVGANSADASKRGIKSPIFQNGTFEFIPIKEKATFSNEPEIPSYSEILCYNKIAKNLAYFLPRKIHSYKVHNDPDFKNFTYGDILSSRAGNLKYIQQNDQLWFLARLWDYDGINWTGGSHFYFVGFFTVERNFLVSEGIKIFDLPKRIQNRIRKNAHFRRQSIDGNREPFRVIIGNRKKSFRFKAALQITPTIAGYLYGGIHDPRRDIYRHGRKILINKNGKPRSFRNFGSVTRTIQAFLDSGNQDHLKYMEEFNDIAIQYSD